MECPIESLRRRVHCRTESRVLWREEGAVRAFGGHALRMAVEKGHLEVVNILLGGGADIHAKGDHVLRVAAIAWSLWTVRLILDRGADLHADNNSVLRASINSERQDVALLLIEWHRSGDWD